MENYATAKYAANIAGISVSEIGIPEDNFVRKKDLIKTNKFKPEPLNGYGDNDFILEKDVQKGIVRIRVIVNSDVIPYVSVRINDGEVGDDVYKDCAIGEEVTLSYVYKPYPNRVAKSVDGWYIGDMRYSFSNNFTFTATEETTVVFKLFFMIVSDETLTFDGNDPSSKSLGIITNSYWVIE